MDDLYTQVEDLNAIALAKYIQGCKAHREGTRLIALGDKTNGDKLIAQSKSLALEGSEPAEKAYTLAKENFCELIDGIY
jgi:hypothetical protein